MFRPEIEVWTLALIAVSIVRNKVALQYTQGMDPRNAMQLTPLSVDLHIFTEIVQQGKCKELMAQLL